MNQEVLAPNPWISKITAAWQSTIGGIINSGRLLIESKADLEHGEFLSMIENDLPFSADTSQRLMAIAHNPLLVNTAHARLLPNSWTTLYELTRLPEPKLRAKIEDGTINPKLERSEVREWLKTARRREMPSEAQEIAQAKKRMVADTWRFFREALENISNLPPAGEVLIAIKAYDRGGITQRRLENAAERLKEIYDAWSEQNNANGSNAGHGDKAAGVQQREQAA